jgi:integrase
MSVKVRQWPSGDWYVVIHHRRRRYTKRCKSHAEALELSDAMAARLEVLGTGGLKALSGPEPQRVVTFETYAAETWLPQVKAAGLAYTTIRRYESSLTNHLIPAFGRMELAEITYRRVKGLCVEKAQTLSRDSVRLILAPLRLILKEAVHDGLLEVNPVQGLGRYTRKPTLEENHEIEPFTPAELNRLLETAGQFRPRYYEFLLLLARTGLRFGEARALEWSDFDLDQRKLHVKRNWPASGKLTVPKTKKSRRTVDLSPQTVQALRGLRARRNEEALKKRKTLQGWVFLSAIGQPVMYSSFRRRTWDPLLKKAKLAERGIHTLRHTFATHLLMAGVNPVYVAKQLGHSRVTTTMNVYAHWIEEQGQVPEVNRLDQVTG